MLRFRAGMSQGYPGRLGSRRRAGGSNTYLDCREMIERERPDIVSVTTPSLARAEPIIFAAEHGVRGIYAEKGLWASLEEAGRVTAALKAHQACPLRDASGGLLERFDEVVLAHLRATLDVLALGEVVELVARAILQRSVGVAGALGAPVRRASLLTAPFVHRAGGDLLGPVFRHAAIFIALLDVLVPALVFP
jgi:predicted dehydrogenase